MNCGFRLAKPIIYPCRYFVNNEFLNNLLLVFTLQGFITIRICFFLPRNGVYPSFNIINKRNHFCTKKSLSKIVFTSLLHIISLSGSNLIPRKVCKGNYKTEILNLQCKQINTNKEGPR